MDSASGSERISVIVPFLGDQGEARSALAMLSSIATRSGDELIVADNTPDSIVARLAPDGISVVRASDRLSASHARNLGAGAASGEWLLFIDADCVPPPDLLDRYRAKPAGPRCGIVAGEVEGAADQDALLARWMRSRRGLWIERHHLGSDPYPAAVTANMLVRRSTFEELRGFRIGGGGDVDLSWRAQENGWELEYRPDVVVRHRDRETLSELAEQAIGYGGHQRVLRGLYGAAIPRPRLLRPLGRSLAGALVWTLAGQLERARFKLIDGVWSGLLWWGQVTGGSRRRQAD